MAKNVALAIEIFGPLKKFKLLRVHAFIFFLGKKGVFIHITYKDIEISIVENFFLHNVTSIPYET